MCFTYTHIFLFMSVCVCADLKINTDVLLVSKFRAEHVSMTMNVCYFPVVMVVVAVTIIHPKNMNANARWVLPACIVSWNYWHRVY